MNLKAHMICHTHWDREWYLTKEQFRTKLVRLIDGLLDIVETQPEYVSFMLDGQTIAIEDYLEIKPYNKERLFNALKQGKIVCGPWYILPDELLISGESHIRNYLIGKKVLEGVAKPMSTAYLPDSFGHPSQMPQIVSGLGMDAMVFWRGVSQAVSKTEFYWQAPGNNGKILCVHLPHGYGNSGNLSADLSAALSRVENLLNSLGEKSTTDTVLLMNGSDHITGQGNIVEIVKGLNEKLNGAEIKLSKIENFLHELAPKLTGLKTYSGEFRSGERSYLLGGTLSTRMELKQANYNAQTEMERYFEPMLAIEKALGGKWDSKGYSDYIWRKILENQPHDSICGCSIDEVHSEMEARYESLAMLMSTLESDAVNRIESTAANTKAGDALKFMLFEPTQDKLASYCETVIDFDRVLVQEVNFTKSTIEDYEPDITHPDMPEGFIIKDEAGREIPYVVLKREKAYDTLYQDCTLPEIYKSNRITVGMLLPGFEFGLHTLTVEKSYKQPEPILCDEENTIENSFYKIVFENGAFTVTDKATGAVYENVHTFIDKGDAGDEYTYSWPETDSEMRIKLNSAKLCRERMANIGEKLIIKGELSLPSALTDDRKARSTEMKSSPYTITVSLLRGVNCIGFETELTNNSEDHRLQVQFPSNTNAAHSVSYNTFALEKRDVDLIVPEKWAEYPQSTHPTHGFVSVTENENGVCLGSQGLPEFEAVREDGQTRLNLTLLRAVGWLSRTDLITREGNGGWTIATPNAQCKRTYKFKYGISFANANVKPCEQLAVLEKSALAARCYQLHKGLENTFQNKNSLSFLSQLPAEIRLSAIKISEDGSGITVRMYNISQTAVTAYLKLPACVKEAQQVSLTEDSIAAVNTAAEKLTFSIEPAQILTLKFKLA